MEQRPLEPLGASQTPSETTEAKILAIVPYPPNPLRPRTVSMICDLASFAKVDLIYLDHGERFDLPNGLKLSSVTSLPNRRIARFLRIAAGFLFARPIVYQYYHSRELIRCLLERDLSTYDAVYVERIPLQELNIRHPNVVLDMQDCYTSLVGQLAQSAPGIRKWGYKLDRALIRDYEAKACNSARRVLCTAEREAEALRSIGVTKPIDVVVHSSNFKEFARRKLRNHQKKVLAFHGKLTYPPNADALENLHRLIFGNFLPGVYQVRIAGAGSEKLQSRYPGFDFAGYVDDIGTFLGSADLSVLPVVFGAGVSNKALESLSVGVPVIATPQIAAGLPNVDRLSEAGLFVRDLPGFPDAIERFFGLSKDDRQRISDNCVEYARCVNNPEKRREHLKKCVLPNSHLNEA